MFLRDDLRRLRIRPVVGRHDLHAVFVEDVLDVGVQGGQVQDSLSRIVETHEQREPHVEVFESSLYDDGHRIPAEPGRPLLGQEQQRWICRHGVS